MIILTIGNLVSMLIKQCCSVTETEGKSNLMKIDLNGQAKEIVA